MKIPGIKTIKKVIRSIIEDRGKVTMGTLSQGYIITDGAFLTLWKEPIGEFPIDKLPTKLGSYKGVRLKEQDSIVYPKKILEDSIGDYSKRDMVEVNWLLADSGQNLLCKIDDSYIQLASFEKESGEAKYFGANIRYLEYMETLLISPVYQHCQESSILRATSDLGMGIYRVFELNDFLLGDTRPAAKVERRRGVEV